MYLSSSAGSSDYLLGLAVHFPQFVYMLVHCRVVTPVNFIRGNHGWMSHLIFSSNAGLMINQLLGEFNSMTESCLEWPDHHTSSSRTTLLVMPSSDCRALDHPSETHIQRAMVNCFCHMASWSLLNTIGPVPSRINSCLKYLFRLFSQPFNPDACFARCSTKHDRS